MDGHSQSEADWRKGWTCLVFSKGPLAQDIQTLTTSKQGGSKDLTVLQCVGAVTTSDEMLPQQTGNIFRECRWGNMALRSLFF